MATRKVSGAEILAQARTWLGVPYLYGGTTRQGVDCSGLIMQVAHALGIASCPRTSEEQWAWCEHIPASEIGAGDLVFFVGAEIDPPPGHVGFVVSPGTMINAPYTGTVVRYDHYSNGPGVNRIIGYGRLRGATRSNSGNPYTKSGKTTAGSSVPVFEGIAGTVVSIIIVICVILLLVVALGALIGAGLIFKGA